MNLGGRRLRNDELQAAVEGCGCRDVRTYQASGNVIVVDERPEAELASALEEHLAATLGYDVPVFLRRAAEVRTIAAATPFSDAERATSTGKPQVIFLGSEPPASELSQLLRLFPERDRVVPAGRQLHWLPTAGLAETDLDFRRTDAVANGTTVRTHGTVQRLAAKFLSGE